MIFTFWEGEMPAYIKLCMKTWKFDFVLLNYATVNQYTALDTASIQGYTLPQIADIIRVHVLRDNGGYWLDADTIMLSDVLPEETILGNNDTRMNTIGYLHAKEPHEQMFEEWSEHQFDIIKYHYLLDRNWDIMGNRFTDYYLKRHPGIIIGDITEHWAETYMIDEFHSRYDKYRELYFNSSYYLHDFKPTNMLMLHNSWTPNWYKQLDKIEVLSSNCTMSNILKEVTK